MKETRLDKYELEKFLPKFFSDNKVQASFFSSFYPLHTFLNYGSNQLKSLNFNGKDYLLLHKLEKKEYRFLFINPEKGLFEEFEKEFFPRYVGLNLLQAESDLKVKSNTDEILVEVSKIASLEDKKIKHDYNLAKKHNPDLLVESYVYDKHIGRILEFLENWRYTRTDKQNSYARVENDLQFFTSFGRAEKTKGIVILDKEKIIGYSIFTSHDLEKSSCISLFSKVLRGYKYLGMFLAVEKAREMKKEGYNTAYLGSVNNDFKKHFFSLGEKLMLYSAELYRSEKMILRVSPEEYSNIILG